MVERGGEGERERVQKGEGKGSTVTIRSLFLSESPKRTGGRETTGKANEWLVLQRQARRNGREEGRRRRRIHGFLTTRDNGNGGWLRVWQQREGLETSEEFTANRETTCRWCS